MRITLDFRKTVEENAASYFEKAKKAKRKIEGAKKALAISLEKLKREEEKKVASKEPTLKKIKKKEWFEKFRWFVSSEGFLVVAGRDATTNEILIKKQTESGDIVFHTDAAGSPFVVIKAEGREISKNTVKEASEFCASFSRSWKRGLTTTEVYSIKPDQISKEAKAGEYLTKGSFMIHGDRTYFTPEINIAIGVYNEKFMAGPISAIKKHCKEYFLIVQGDRNPSDVAKQIKKKLGGDLDEIIRALPAGTCNIS